MRNPWLLDIESGERFSSVVCSSFVFVCIYIAFCKVAAFLGVVWTFPVDSQRAETSYNEAVQVPCHEA